MADIQPLKSLAHIKTLADPRRLAILRRLMAAPATLSQLGRALGESPAWVRHHLKLLESAGLIEIASVEISEGYLEKYYRARAGAFFFQELILPESGGRPVIAILGSHDLALELLAERLQTAGLALSLLPVGSLDGLVALRQGLAHLSACHLLDVESGEYNRPFVQRIFPDRPMALVTLAHREQGLLLAPGNPRGVRGLEDLLRDDIRLIHRNRGSGTRLWLDYQMRRLGLAAGPIRSDQEAKTHTQVALAIRQGQADAGLGLLAAARRFGLDFLPLFQERFDLVLSQDQVGSREFAPLLDSLQNGEYHRLVEGLGGYDTTHTGEYIHLS